MDSAKLNDWLQVIGLFGVIASLIFVGLQMKQDREIAQSAAFQARTDSMVQNLAEVSSNPFFMSAVDKRAAGEALLPSEQFALAAVARNALSLYENLHFQYTNGFIDDDRWQGAMVVIKSNLLQDFIRDEYAANPSRWRGSFRAVINEVLAEIDAERSSGQ